VIVFATDVHLNEFGRSVKDQELVIDRKRQALAYERLDEKLWFDAEIGPLAGVFAKHEAHPFSANMLDLRPIEIVRRPDEHIHAAAVIGFENERHGPIPLFKWR